MANEQQRLPEQIEFLIRRLRVAEENGNKLLEGNAHEMLGLCYQESGNIGRAIEHHQMHLEIAKLIRDEEGEGNAYRNLGNSFLLLGDYEEAMRKYRVGLRVAKETGDRQREGSIMGQLGVCYDQLHRYDKAIEHYEVCLKIAKEIGDKAGEECAVGNLGRSYRSLGQYQKAIEHSEIHLKIAEEIGDKRGEGSATENSGSCYFRLGQYHKAIEYYGKQLKIAKEIGDKTAEGSAIGNLGSCYISLGQYHKAIEHCEMRLKIAKGIGDKAGEGSAIGNLGNCYSSLGQYHKAIEHHEMALKITRKVGNKAGEGSANGNLGNCYTILGHYHKAIEHLEMHLKISKEIHDKNGEGCAAGNLGNCYSSLGQHHKATQHYEMQLEIAKETGDKAIEGTAIGNLGSCYLDLGQYHKSIEYYEMCLKIATEIGDKAGEGSAIVNMGKCYYSLGQYHKGIDHYEMGLKIAKEIGDKVGEGCAFSSMGSCYFSLGQYHKAIEHHEMHLNITKETGEKAGEGSAIGNLGNCYLILGQYLTAIDYNEISLKIAKEIGNKAGEGSSTGNLGNCYVHLGQYHKAIENYEMHLKIAKEIGDKDGEAAAICNLGNCYIILGQYQKAIEHLEMALPNTNGVVHIETWAKILVNFGNAFKMDGKYEKAEKYYRESVKSFEELFKNAPDSDQSKVSIIDTFIATYRALVEVLLCQGKNMEGLMIADRGRSKALRALLTKAGSVWPFESLPETGYLKSDELVEVAQALNNTVIFSLLRYVICAWVMEPDRNDVIVLPQDLVSRLSNPSVAQVTELESLTGRVEELLKKMTEPGIVECEDRSLSFLYSEESNETRNRDFEQLSSHFSLTKVTHAEQPRPFGLADSASIQSKRQSTPIHQGDPFHAYDTAGISGAPTSATCELDDRAAKDPDLNSSLRYLFQMLFGPLRQLIRGTQVVVVPDGALALVPFAALIDEDGCYVAETLQVRLVPSLATAKMIMERPEEPHSIESCPLIVGDPDVGGVQVGEEIVPVPKLPFAREEAQMIGKLLNVQPLTGDEATKESFLQKAESANLIHIAAHGDMDRGEILLAPNSGKAVNKLEDVLLEISDLEKKRLRAKLVVLSCCHSGRGAVKAEGVVGIGRAFLSAGARAVLVSLWAVNDEATMYFMKTFYEHLIRGETASYALSQAMKAMREKEELLHPRYWAPFVLIGDNVAPFASG